MSADQTKRCVLAFLDAFYAGDVAGVERSCDEALTSLTYTPVEVFPHHGLKEGKVWITKAVQIQQQRYSARSFEIHSMVVDGNKAATMVEARLTKRSDQRVVHLTIAEFFTLRGGLIVEHRAFFDSFDFIQQLLGRDLTGDFVRDLNATMQR